MKKTTMPTTRARAVAAKRRSAPSQPVPTKTVSKSPKPAAKAKPASKGTTAKARVARLSRARRPHRMVLIDVENTSSEERLTAALEVLRIDRKAQRTDLVAVGNWKAVGARTARLLARKGTTLIHSAPATGVRDWSDLWIAVAAGRWIATAEPGDRLDIVSDDHAFDAVADAAAGAGVDFHRISYRVVVGAPEDGPSEARPRRRRRGGRRRGTVHPEVASPGIQDGESRVSVPPASSIVGTETDPIVSPYQEGPPATPSDIRKAIQELTGGDPLRWVNLDLVGSALRAKGFSRPPGSPRLVTRARQLLDVEVSSTGMARIRPVPSPESAADVGTEKKPPEATTPPPTRPARRRQSPSAARAIFEG